MIDVFEESMDRIKAAWRSGRLIASLVIAALAPGAALADREWNLQPPVTPIAHEIFELHAIIFWIC
ncbi:MAG: hypothetical protein ACREX7_08430, partial [Casimicrobiaceae bacterium]